MLFRSAAKNVFIGKQVGNACFFHFQKSADFVGKRIPTGGKEVTFAGAGEDA